MARVQIEENHPLNSTPFAKVFPLFTPIFNLCGSKPEAETHQENQRLLGEETKASPSLSGGKRRSPKLDKEMQEDPFNFLGFGMVAYRDLMFVLFLLFTVITLLMIPVM